MNRLLAPLALATMLCAPALACDRVYNLTSVVPGTAGTTVRTICEYSGPAVPASEWREKYSTNRENAGLMSGSVEMHVDVGMQCPPLIHR